MQEIAPVVSNAQLANCLWLKAKQFLVITGNFVFGFLNNVGRHGNAFPGHPCNSCEHCKRGHRSWCGPCCASHQPWLSVGALAAVGAVGAVGAARRASKRSSLAQGLKVTALKKQRSLTGAKVVVCAGVNFPEGRKLRVAVVGGGPAGASCADRLAKDGVETYLIERKMDNCKPCGGAIPLCMIDEFDLPKDIVDRQVRKMTMISPTNKEVQIGQTLKD